MYDTLDKFARLAFDAELSISILGNPQTSDFELVETAQLPLSDDRLQILRARGMYFLGVAGLVGGKPQTALTDALDNATIEALASAFLAHLATVLHLPAKPTHESAVQWLAALHELKDPR